jgi:hypothetical protein
MAAIVLYMMACETQHVFLVCFLALNVFLWYGVCVCSDQITAVDWYVPVHHCQTVIIDCFVCWCSLVVAFRLSCVDIFVCLASSFWHALSFLTFTCV